MDDVMTITADANAAEAFAEAYDRFADDIFRHCYFRCFERERARELMQEAFMKVWEYLSKGNDIDNVRALLYRTANNLVIDDARRKKKREIVSFEDMAEAGFDVPGEDGRDNALVLDAKRVVEIMYQLDEPYRTAVVMRYIDELPPRDIAEMLGETANVVSVRINRGLKMLRGLLEPHG